MLIKPHKPQIQTPEKLPVLKKLCWQREDIKNLTSF